VDVVWFGAVAALVAGPFLLYNTLAYGDPIASRAVALMLPHNSEFKLTDFYWFKDPFFGMLWKSFWGAFGWQRVFMPDWFYAIFGVLTLAGLAGGLRLLLQRAFSVAQVQACAAYLGHGLLIYAAIVLYSLRLIAWQGRELFPALPGTAILLGLGLVGLFLGTTATRPAHPAGEIAGRRSILATLVIAALIVGLLATNIYALRKLGELFGSV
jgi:hypothetical protein